ncbi:hypothetical protein TNCV_2677391 [Trichonephila clavipes]|nr:hypothetical protein TNCV_2677391 [Trichonephila clavipes]
MHMFDARNLGVRFFYSSGIGSLCLNSGASPKFSTSSPKNPRAGLFVLSSIISLIGPEAGAVLHHLKIYGFSQLFNAGTFLTHPTKRNFTTSGQGGTRIKIPSRFRGEFCTGTNLASHQYITICIVSFIYRRPVGSPLDDFSSPE